MMLVLDVQDVTRTYRMGDVDVHALRGVTLSLTRGEFGVRVVRC